MSPQIVDLATHPYPHVTVAELSAYWHVSERMIYRDIVKGALPVVRVGEKGLIRIPIEDARRYGKPSGNCDISDNRDAAPKTL